VNVSRKKIVLATAALIAAAIATTATDAFSSADKNPKKAVAPGQRLSGTWMSTVTLQNPPPGVDPTFRALDTFTPSGEVLVSSSQGLPGTRSLAQGEWMRVGDHRFSSQFFWFRFDSTGKFIGLQRVGRTITLSANLSAFQSVDAVEVIAPDGTVVATLHAVETARRIGT
jgi:hypothetical protein